MILDNFSLYDFKAYKFDDQKLKEDNEVVFKEEFTQQITN